MKVLFGKYHDGNGVRLLVINTQKYQYLKPILEQISLLEPTNGIKHILIGQMLGYVCPYDISKITKQNAYFYEIDFSVENKTSHMNHWCPIDNKNITKVLGQLKMMKEILDYLGKSVNLNISIQHSSMW